MSTPNEILSFELSKIIGIKSDKHQLIKKHIAGEIDLEKTGEQLSAAEKKSIKINSRSKVSREFFSTFDSDTLDFALYRSSIECSKHNVRNKIGLLATLQEIEKQAPTKRFEFVVSHDENTCNWCKSKDGERFSPSHTFIDLVNSNCNCQVFRGNAVVNF